jgi:hypothetical protein
MLVRDALNELRSDAAESGHPEDRTLDILIARAIRRGDDGLARSLSTLPPRRQAGHYVLMDANCPTLARIAAVCDPVEALAWRRAVVHAGVRGDRRRVRALLDLAARRCSD